MISVDLAIFGAGPAGLTLARVLLDKGITSFVVFEKEEDAGGLCRSKEIDGAPLDTGGGHFLDSKNKDVLDFVFRFLPEKEWNLHERNTKLKLHDQLLDWPLESNIWQLPVTLQIKYLTSLFQSSSALKNKIPRKFEKWVLGKYGSEIAQNYMIPYNKKMWGKHYLHLNTLWLSKIPDVSFEEVLLSCLEKRSYGKIPAHNNFYYPKNGGYGKVWANIAKELDGNLLLSMPIKSFDCQKLIINNKYKTKCVINTIPWPILSEVSNFPSGIKRQISKLKNVAIQIDYFKNNLDTLAHWTYIPDERVTHHRILHRHNFVPDSHGYWTETNAERVLVPSSKIFSAVNEYSYPVNSLDRGMVVSSILDWGARNNIHGLGRWGKWEHLNSDVVVEQALNFAEKIT